LLADEVRRIKDVADEADTQNLALLDISKLFEGSSVVNDLEPALWFNIVRDESNIDYAVTQLTADYRDLDRALGESDTAAAVIDPTKAMVVKEQVLDILYDIELLRQSGRRLLARTCLMLAEGPDFRQMKTVHAIETDQMTHKDWLESVKPILEEHGVGSQNCFEVLGYTPPDP
jgi:hypothetical protein